MNAKIVGCGLSGVTAAVILKRNGYDVTIYETRNHIAGNCYDSIFCGTKVHNYGPHIFHTDNEKVFSFLSEFTDWIPFEYKPYGNTKLGLISLPYSKKTIKQLGYELTADEISEYIFKDYSEKQWGVPFEDIPKSITNRIPDTANMEDPTWFKNQKYQCLPKHGYTKMFKKMLEGITVKLNCNKNDWKKDKSDITIYTGKIDEYYNFCFGKLPYRSLEFKHHITESKLENLVINQNNKDVEYTRKYDHSYFDPEHNQDTTVITEEYPVPYNGKNIPYYPLTFGEGPKIYKKYEELSYNEKDVIFLGRLATYKYLDMWMAVNQVFIRLKKQNITL